MSALDKAARVVEASFMLWDQEVTPQQATAIARAVLMAVLPDIDDRLAKAQVRVYLRAILNEEPK